MCVGKMSEFDRAKWPRQIIDATVIGVLSAGAGYLDHMVLDEPYTIGLFSFLHIGLFALNGVWFGAWGVLAVYIGETAVVMPALGRDMALLQSFSALLVALIPAWAFRYFKADPRIRTSRDGALFLLFGVILLSLASTLTTPTIFYIYGYGDMNWLVHTMPWQFYYTSIPTLFLSFPLLLIGSKTVIEARAYCKGWFS